MQHITRGRLPEKHRLIIAGRLLHLVNTVRLPTSKQEKKPKKIYTRVEIKSAFTGGDSSWIHSIEKTLNQSIQYKNGAKAGKYIVSIVFFVDKEGDISDVRCTNDPVGFGMEEQVLRAIKKKPKWIPSSQGIPVRPYRTS